jgi:hypothetical protein
MTTNTLPSKIESPNFSTLDHIVTGLVESMWEFNDPDSIERLQDALVVAALEAVYGQTIVLVLRDRALSKLSELVGGNYE